MPAARRVTRESPGKITAPRVEPLEDPSPSCPRFFAPQQATNALGSIPAFLPLTAVRMNLLAGTYEPVADPGTAIFDDVAFVRLP
jgi:hypothetical protein